MGADKGVFMSAWQRSLYNVNGLAARPWWTKAQTGNAKFLTVRASLVADADTVNEVVDNVGTMLISSLHTN